MGSRRFCSLVGWGSQNMWWISGNYSLTINHFSVTLIKQLMAMNNKLCMNFCGNINKLYMNFCGNIKLVLRIHLTLCRYPLTGYQAFSICLASIDSKLCCTIWSIYGDLLQVQPLNSIFCLLIIPLEQSFWVNYGNLLGVQTLKSSFCLLSVSWCMAAGASIKTSWKMTPPFVFSRG